MIETIIHKIGALVVAAAISVSGFFAPTPQFGTAIPSIAALFETTLANKIGTADTSLTLTSATTVEGSVLPSGQYGFIIDEGTAAQEFVLGTVSSTAVTNLVRGVSVINPNATSSAMIFQHRRGSSIKITNYPQLAILSRILNGTDAIENVLKYATTTASFVSSSAQLAHKAYVDSVVIAGGVIADNTTPGISRIATASNLAAGTGTSGGYSYVAPSGAFNTTSSAANIVPVTKTNGKLSQGFLDLTEGFTFSGGVTSTGALVQSGTATFSGNTNITGTTTFSGTVNGATKFGGTGADGDFTATSTVFDLGGSTTFVKNFNNLNITGTSSISFTNASTSGTVVIFKVKGNAVINSASSSAINLDGRGASAGNRGFGLVMSPRQGSSFSVPNSSNTGFFTMGGFGVGLSISHKGKSIPVFAGASSSGGGGCGGIGITQGVGGGGLYLEVLGNLNLTGTISSKGLSGSSSGSCNAGGPYILYGDSGGGSASDGSPGSVATGKSGSTTVGAGGGGAGSFLAVYGGIATSTPTVTLTGGAGETGKDANGGNGGSGSWAVEKNTEF